MRGGHHADAEQCCEERDRNVGHGSDWDVLCHGGSMPVAVYSVYLSVLSIRLLNNQNDCNPDQENSEASTKCSSWDSFGERCNEERGTNSQRRN